MGCPDIYFRQMLEMLAYILNNEQGNQLSLETIEAWSDKELKTCIEEKKKVAPVMRFYYDAGMAAEYVLGEVDRSGATDAFNACAGSLIQFEKFLGIM